MLFIYLFRKTMSHVSQVGLELIMMTLNLILPPAPKKLYIRPLSCSVCCCFMSKRRQSPSWFSLPINLSCEVCCAVWLCGIPWLLVAGTPFHPSCNAYTKPVLTLLTASSFGLVGQLNNNMPGKRVETMLGGSGCSGALLWPAALDSGIFPGLHYVPLNR